MSINKQEGATIAFGVVWPLLIFSLAARTVLLASQPGIFF